MTIVSDNPDPRQVNNWQDIDTTTIAGLYAIDHEIDLRLYGESIPHIKHYSTDLNHAFELADSQTHIRTRRGSQDEQIWGVQLKLQDETYQDTSLAVAICKAWLGWYDWHEALLDRIAAEDTEAHDANGRGAV